jgi:hypothetical protein
MVSPAPTFGMEIEKKQIFFGFAFRLEALFQILCREILRLLAVDNIAGEGRCK